VLDGKQWLLGAFRDVAVTDRYLRVWPIGLHWELPLLLDFQPSRRKYTYSGRTSRASGGLRPVAARSDHKRSDNFMQIYSDSHTVCFSQGLW
jgi:hypothetical protein